MPLRRFLLSHLDEEGLGHITGEEHHHLSRVIRARPGTRVEAIDGKGHLLTGEVVSLDRHQTLVRGELLHQPPPSEPRWSLGVSLLKRQPMDQLITQLAELGVPRLRPLVWERTELSDRPESGRQERWSRLCLQALKVNRLLYPMDISPPTPLNRLDNLPEGRVLLDIEAPALPLTPPRHDTLILVGPPGDMTAEERDALHSRGFISYNLNVGVLRTEMAATAAAAIWAALSRRP